jgi:hypothetical protein
MLMEVLMSKLELNLDTLLMYSLGHLRTFRKHSQLQFLVSQSYSLMKVLGHTLLFANRLRLMQLLMMGHMVQTLSLLMTTKFNLAQMKMVMDKSTHYS